MAHGIRRHFQRRDCADSSWILSWVSNDGQRKSDRVFAFKVQMGSENYCGEGSRRSEMGRKGVRVRNSDD